MCYSYEASLVALVVGLSGSIALFRISTINSKIVGGFLGYVSLMQGIDTVLWKHQTCDNFHKNVTSLGMVLNISQPVALALFVYLFNPYLKYGIIILIVSGVYLLNMILFIYAFSKESHCTSPRKDDPHLVWNWTMLETKTRDWAIYLSALCLISIFGLSSLRSGIMFATALIFGATTSYILYPRQSVGSLWCFFSALSPIFLYGYSMLPRHYRALSII